MKPPYVRCVVDDVVYTRLPGFEAMPSPPSRVDVDLPAGVVAALAEDPDDDTAATTTLACLTFTVGFMGFSYCAITDFGKVSLR